MPVFTDSESYWQERYRQRRDSGNGSHGRPAEFKAKILNELVERHSIQTVIESGVGGGHQLTDESPVNALLESRAATKSHTAKNLIKLTCAGHVCSWFEKPALAAASSVR
jgi:hypothetical protein